MWERPPGALDDLDTRLVCILASWAEPQRPTVRRLARLIGRAPGTTHERLKRLYHEGLVDWQPTAAGTLHSTVRIVQSSREVTFRER